MHFSVWLGLFNTSGYTECKLVLENGYVLYLGTLNRDKCYIKVRYHIWVHIMHFSVWLGLFTSSG